jgi:hypothetical protein
MVQNSPQYVKIQNEKLGVEFCGAGLQDFDNMNCYETDIKNMSSKDKQI